MHDRSCSILPRIACIRVFPFITAGQEAHRQGCQAMATSSKAGGGRKSRRNARGLPRKRTPEGESGEPSQEDFVKSANTTELEGEIHTPRNTAAFRTVWRDGWRPEEPKRKSVERGGRRAEVIEEDRHTQREGEREIYNANQAPRGINVQVPVRVSTSVLFCPISEPANKKTNPRMNGLASPLVPAHLSISLTRLPPPQQLCSLLRC